MRSSVKFTAHHTKGDAVAAAEIADLNDWRNRLHGLKLVGQDAELYGGLAYGNLSKRVGERSFIITASQTSGLERLDGRHYVLIEDFELVDFSLRSAGLLDPSSESMTHAAIYEACESVRCVYHVHSPSIWRSAEEFGIPATDEGATEGTYDLVLAITQLFERAVGKNRGTIAIGGHQDGIMSFGRTADEAGQSLLRYIR